MGREGRKARKGQRSRNNSRDTKRERNGAKGQRLGAFGGLELREYGRAERETGRQRERERDRE
jgi:hypothetical protein